MSGEVVRLDPDLVALLVCPVSKAKLVQIGGTLVSTDATTRRRYQITDGIPNMMVEESEVMSVDEWKRLLSEFRV